MQSGRLSMIVRNKSRSCASASFTSPAFVLSRKVSLQQLNRDRIVTAHARRQSSSNTAPMIALIGASICFNSPQQVQPNAPAVSEIAVRNFVGKLRSTHGFSEVDEAQSEVASLFRDEA